MKIVCIALGMMLSLSCFAEVKDKDRLPTGEWQKTCDLSKTKLDKYILTSHCAPYQRKTTMDMRYCGRGVANHGGLLVCEGYDTYPKGDFLKSVVQSRNLGSGHWVVEVTRPDGSESVQNTLVVSHCEGRQYQNVNGILNCISRNDSGWSFSSSCKSITVNQTKYEIKAKCKNDQGQWLAVNYNYAQCLEHDVLNKNGALVCTKKLWWQD